jgi:hypothetical protein
MARKNQSCRQKKEHQKATSLLDTNTQQVCRPSGRPQQTIRHGYTKTIEENLNFANSKLKTWVPTAQDKSAWAEHVEKALKLPPNTYTKSKAKKKKNRGCRLIKKVV